MKRTFPIIFSIAFAIFTFTGCSCGGYKYDSLSSTLGSGRYVNITKTVDGISQTIEESFYIYFNVRNNNIFDLQLNELERIEDSYHKRHIPRLKLNGLYLSGKIGDAEISLNSDIHTIEYYDEIYKDIDINVDGYVKNRSKLTRCSIADTYEIYGLRMTIRFSIPTEGNDGNSVTDIEITIED